MRRSYWRFLILNSAFLMAGSALGGEIVYSNDSQFNPLNASNAFARSAAFGSAFVGLADDTTALFTNPAGLSFLTRDQLATNSDFWLVDTFQESLLFGGPLGPGIGFGTAIQYFNDGTFDGRDGSGSLTNAYSAGRWDVEAGGGMELFRGLALGAEMTGERDTLDDLTTTDLTADLGLLWRPLKDFRIGAAFNDFPLSAAAGSADPIFLLGTSYAFLLDRSNRFLAAVSGSFETTGASSFQAGVEYGLEGRLFFRVGYQEILEDNDLTGFYGLTAGVGLILSDFYFDYAYLPYGDLGTSHRITVGYQFTAPAPSAPPTPAAPPVYGRGLPDPRLLLLGAPPVIFSHSPTPEAADSDSLSVSPNVSVDPVTAGKALEEKGQTSPALELYEQAVHENPNNVNGWIALGNLYFHLNQKKDAVYCFEQVLRLEPDHLNLFDWLEQYKTINGPEAAP